MTTERELLVLSPVSFYTWLNATTRHAPMAGCVSTSFYLEHDTVSGTRDTRPDGGYERRLCFVCSTFRLGPRFSTGVP